MSYKPSEIFNKQTRTCSVCGRKFIKSSGHIFKLTNFNTNRLDYQCCYTCYCEAKENKEYEKEHRKQERANKRKKVQ